MNFGKWNVTSDEVSYSGNGLQRFIIPMSRLTDVADMQGTRMYKWIIMATEEDWLSPDDLYDLNFALVYAAGRRGADFDYAVFDRTLEYQYDLLDSEEDEG